MRGHMGDYPTNERGSCELRPPVAGGTRVRVQTGLSHADTLRPYEDSEECVCVCVSSLT